MKKFIGLLFVVGLVYGCGDDDDSNPASSSVSSDKYADTIVGGTWNDSSGEAMWTFSADGTVVYEFWETTYNWTIVGSEIILTDSDGNQIGEHPYEIVSLTSSKLVYLEKTDKVDGSGTLESEVEFTR